MKNMKYKNMNMKISINIYSNNKYFNLSLVVIGWLIFCLFSAE